MSAEDPIEFAANRVADGKPVDWSALARRVSSDEERERLECLRILWAIADVHRSGDPTRSVDPTISADGNLLRRSDPTPPEDRAGETWGRYTLLAEVGSGSFGSVYRAWDPELEREIAIKILHRHLADPELKERLLREGRALAKVRDPNIVSVFGVESYGDRVGLCMEFVRGETLEDVLRSHGTLNAREAVLVGQDVCRALAAVHRAKFVHRDVKAKNIMRERAGRIVLMDFGTGREVEHLESTNSRWNVAGTPLYMAPEVLAGQPASSCSDVYSVGVLLYHLVTGKYPVEGHTLKDIRAAHMSAKRTPVSERRSDLPTAFIRVVDRALTANPQQRCPSAGELLEALAATNEDAFAGRSSRARHLAIVAVSLAGVLGGITVFGAASSRYFNAALGRSEFANEGIWDWFSWGVKSIVAPTVLFMFALLSLGLLLVCRRLLLGTSRKARDLEHGIKARVRRWHLDEVGNLASCMLLVSALVLVSAWWYFLPLIEALLIHPDVSTWPAEQLALLSPHFQPYHETYRASFIWVTIICLMVWYPPLRLAAKRREPLNRGLLAGGAAVVLLAILMLDFPYRMLSHNDVFEAAQWGGERCYILGERGDDLLLFCPRVDPPRNRIVKSGAKELERLGVNESLFIQFSANR